MFKIILIVLLISSGVAHANISDDDYATLELIFFSSYDCKVEVLYKNIEDENCKIMRKHIPKYKNILTRSQIVNDINSDSRHVEISHHIKYITKDLQEISKYKKYGE